MCMNVCGSLSTQRVTSFYFTHCPHRHFSIVRSILYLKYTAQTIAFQTMICKRKHRICKPIIHFYPSPHISNIELVSTAKPKESKKQDALAFVIDFKLAWSLIAAQTTHDDVVLNGRNIGDKYLGFISCVCEVQFFLVFAYR